MAATAREAGYHDRAPRCAHGIPLRPVPRTRRRLLHASAAAPSPTIDVPSMMPADEGVSPVDDGRGLDGSGHGAEQRGRAEIVTDRMSDRNLPGAETPACRVAGLVFGRSR
jgi:hypothetical protein